MITRMLNHWDHGLTSCLGAITVAGAAELAGKLLGVVALVAGITCSIRREIRETRQDPNRRKGR